MAKIRPAVVFDCNLFLQAVGKGGNHAYRCLLLVEENELRLLMSNDCLAEIDEVLRRPELRQLFPLLDDQRVDDLMAWLREHAELIDPVPHVFEYPVDPKDEPYLNLAIAADAVYLVSWDKHIRRLANPALEEGRSFLNAFPRVTILDPSEFLRQFYSSEG